MALFFDPAAFPIRPPTSSSEGLALLLDPQALVATLKNGSLEDLALLADCNEMYESALFISWVLEAVLDRLKSLNLPWHGLLDSLLDNGGTWEKILGERAALPDRDPRRVLLDRVINGVEVARDGFKSVIVDASSEEVGTLFKRFPSSVARKMLVSDGTWTPQQMSALLTDGGPLWATAFLEHNSKVTPAHLDALGREVLQPAREVPMLFKKNLLVHLLDAGWRMPPEMGQTVQDEFGSVAMVNILSHPCYPLSREDLHRFTDMADPSYLPSFASDVLALPKDILAQPGRTKEDAEWLLEYVSTSQTKQSRTSGRQWIRPDVAFLQRPWAQDLWPRLWAIMRPGASGWPPIVATIDGPLESNIQLFEAMILLADAAQYRQMWDSVHSESIRSTLLKFNVPAEWMTLSLLKSGRPEQWAALSSEEIEPFIHHSDGEVRQKAILAMGFAERPLSIPRKPAFWRKRA